ncbi:hypothetical protein LPB72_17490 [Hydrogenophaga crassostreae]|uniref:Glyoxalase n=1 Tax=Hydrogenophaga crassostreae TaxID=1763535 RepID=A0A167GX00_9BURK|nr:VOC family protein [Hydrogenophaga crassostreae]AOW12792.1 hypothetical protein LPB072_07995 [Hydrogenophaga crassostreae]OAD39980.1 hypothetical protein LPB72_17490 [Hydrogenophaga crassostreae]
MLSGVCVGTNNMAAAGIFYDAVLATLGMRCVAADAQERAYAGQNGKASFFVLQPFNGQKATFGNGTQVMFAAPDAEAVKAFHAAVLRCGGSDEGLPGPRNYSPDYYGAYGRDLDGNKLNVSVSTRQ